MQRNETGQVESARDASSSWCCLRCRVPWAESSSVPGSCPREHRSLGLIISELQNCFSSKVHSLFLLTSTCPLSPAQPEVLVSCPCPSSSPPSAALLLCCFLNTPDGHSPVRLPFCHWWTPRSAGGARSPDPCLQRAPLVLTWKEPLGSHASLPKLSRHLEKCISLTFFLSLALCFAFGSVAIAVIIVAGLSFETGTNKGRDLLYNRDSTAFWHVCTYQITPFSVV